MRERAEEAPRDGLQGGEPGPVLHGQRCSPDERRKIREERRQPHPTADAEQSGKEGRYEAREGGDDLVGHPHLYIGVMRRSLGLIARALAACTAPPAPVGTPPRAASPTSTPGPATASAPLAWRRLADIPTPRSEIAAAVYQQDKVYVIGGFGGPDRVERYDAVTGRWDRIADLPHGVDHAMSAAVFGIQTSGDEGVYVFGGYAGSATARSFRLDVSTGRWSEIAPMPSPRAAGAAVRSIRRSTSSAVPMVRVSSRRRTSTTSRPAAGAPLLRSPRPGIIFGRAKLSGRYSPSPARGSPSPRNPGPLKATLPTPHPGRKL